MTGFFHRLSILTSTRFKAILPMCVVLMASVLLLPGCGDDPTEKKQNTSTSAPIDEQTAHATLSTEYEPEEKPVTLTVEPAVEPAPKPTGPLPENTTCVTAQCHATLATANFVHGPVSEQGCDICHASDTGTHQYPILRPDNETCTFCHSVTGKHSNVHDAVTQAGCLSCHDPHISEKKYLLTRDSIESVCLQCHEMPHGNYPHAPFADGDCTTCHQPHETSTAALLRGGEGSEHCFLCHKTEQYSIANAPFVHKPAADDCTVCHNPHVSDEPDHLNRPVDRLCFDCHNDIAEDIQLASNQHAGVFTADKCVNCHDPHASGRDGLFKHRLDLMCLKCHDKQIETSDGRLIANMKSQIVSRRFLHGPIRSGDCAACHSAHGGSHVSLLKENFPDGFYEKFDLQNYALCFTCHDKQIILEPIADMSTDFRDGDVNLHFLHVNKSEKGRTCKSCHAIHASDNPKHIAEGIPFEGSPWLMPVGFNKTPTGGSCAPGCHQKSAYDRNTPINDNLIPSTGGDQ